MNESIRQISDPLTGIFTHSYFLERLEYETKRAKRLEHWLSLLILRLNNSEGEKKILKNLAIPLKRNIRSIDILCYYKAGFSIILPETDERGAKILNERLFKNIFKPFSIDDGSILDLTPYRGDINYAISTYPTDSHLPRRLILIAENRLE